MILFKKKSDLESFLRNKNLASNKVGFVPTMGAIHDGHISLIRKSKEKNGSTVCSIFVNPTQFNVPKDLELYPRTIEKDIEMLNRAGCDLLFLPDTDEIYPEEKLQLKNFDLGNVASILEGASRPGHFDGVAEVVDRLLSIVKPNYIYLGQKDFQQVKVIERMLSQSTHSLQVVMCPIIREASGLALSSRNLRLSPDEKKQASIIYETLQWIKERVNKISLHQLKEEAVQRINAIQGFKVDYLEFCERENFQVVSKMLPGQMLVVVTAVNVNGTRLLDNILL